jgi:hypothetical protein
MATFKPEEIDKLRRVGNENARKIWLAKWSQADFPEPDPTRHKQIREFIHAKYVAKKWYDAVAKETIVDGKPAAATAPAQPAAAPIQQEVGRLPKQEPLQNILGSDLPPISISSQQQQQPARPAAPVVPSVPVPALSMPPAAAPDTRVRRPVSKKHSHPVRLNAFTHSLSAHIHILSQSGAPAPASGGFATDLFGPVTPSAVPVAAAPVQQQQQAASQSFFGEPAMAPQSTAVSVAESQKKKDDIMARFATMTPAPGPFAGASAGPFGGPVPGYGGQMPGGYGGPMPGYGGPMPGGAAPGGFAGPMPGGFSGPMAGGFPGAGVGQMPGYGIAQTGGFPSAQGGFPGYGGAGVAAPGYGGVQMAGGWGGQPMPGAGGPFGGGPIATGPFVGATPTAATAGYGGMGGGASASVGGPFGTATATPTPVAAKPVAPSPFAGLVTMPSTTGATTSSSNPFGTARPAVPAQQSPPKPAAGASIDLFF